MLLVASLRTGQWGIPKGHIKRGETFSAAAVQEAFEEAGAIGTAIDKPLGKYAYKKADDQISYRVTVHMINVVTTTEAFPEAQRRQSRWVSAKDAPEPQASSRHRPGWL